MPRVLKDPEVRRQEILDTAMKLFYQKGYDSTSIADIANAMHVVPGLCYRYYGSKQEIFDAAVKQYARESSQEFLEVIQDRTKTFKERLHLFGQVMLHKEDHSRYRAFFHQAGNETFHLQLGLEMFKYLRPYIVTEMEELNRTGEINVEDPELMTGFLLYGQSAVWMDELADQQDEEGLEMRLRKIRDYIYKLLDISN